MLVFGALHLNESVAKQKALEGEIVGWRMSAESHVGVFECTKDFGSEKYPFRCHQDARRVLGLPCEGWSRRALGRAPSGIPTLKSCLRR